MADIAGKTFAALEWAKTWPRLDGYLKLNAIITQDGDAAFDTSYNDVSVVEYNDGTALRDYTFQLRIVASWSDGFDPVNIEAMNLSAEWLDWVARQFNEGNLPDFGENATIQGIFPVQNVPELNAVYENESLAEYVIQAKIRYIE